MLCLKTETLEHDMYPSYGEILRSNFTSSVHKLLLKSERNSTHSKRSLFSSGDGSGSSSGVEDTSIGRVSKGQIHDKKMSVYRSQLERDVERLQTQLQEEIDLHVALASVVEHSGTPSGSPNKLPDKTWQLIANIQVLEMTVLKLEEELVTLHFQLSQERNERRLAEYQLRHLPSNTPSPLIYNPTYLAEPISPRISTHSGSCMADLLQLDLATAVRQSQLAVADQPSIISTKEEDAEQYGRNFQKSMGIRYSLSEAFEELNKDFLMKDLWQQPNKLSEEMVKCMRNIFLCLAHSSNITSKQSCSEDIPSPRSPQGILSSSSLASSSDSSLNPSLFRSWSVDSRQSYEGVASVDAFDPYRVDGKLSWVNVGRYSSAVEVSWMSVGKKQLEYAAATLKGFRFLVEQLVKVNPACMRSNEKLAFWINLYNTLIMHAYLAYGVPKSEIKFFSLMQKVSYTVGGLSVSAAEIEYSILKMKPPAHRPQIALVLALHKFKLSEERTYSIDNPDSIVSFALSCGMYSSPAVRIFTPDDIREQLHESLRDYIQASVGISSKGKLLVPKLLHCYAKGIVEDSLLADWICRYLSHEQASIVRDCTSQRKQRLLGARGFTIVPFDSRFRYLFLVEEDRP